MASSADQFCSLCDPSPIKAIEWCSDCSEFLCEDCTRHHKNSKLLKSHCLFSVDKYQLLPTFVKDLKVTCDEHEERLDSYCPVHHTACCIRCVFASHKSCEGTGPLKDFIHNTKESPAFQNVKQTMKDIRDFIQKETIDTNHHKDSITSEQKNIQGDITQFRAELNARLDHLENEYRTSLNSKVNVLYKEAEDSLKRLDKMDRQLQSIDADYKTIADNASDRQAFLSLHDLMSVVDEKEKQIETWICNKTFNKKHLHFSRVQTNFFNLNTFGSIDTVSMQSNIRYVRSKDKEAQIQGPSSASRFESLKMAASYHLDLNHVNNIITGCDKTMDGNIVISQYNSAAHSDCISLHDRNGALFKTVTRAIIGSVFSVCVIDKNRIAFACYSGFHIISLVTLKVSSNTTINECLGVAYDYDIYVYLCCPLGLFKYDINTSKNVNVFREKFGTFSCIAYFDGKLYYTLGDRSDAVKCYNERKGIVVWTFKNPSLLKYPRGLAVDKNGTIYAVGHTSNNIVAISDDGKTGKEVSKIVQPTTICYIRIDNQLLVCTIFNDAHFYDIISK